MTEYRGLFACLLSKSNNMDLAIETSPHAKNYLNKYNLFKEGNKFFKEDAFGYNNTYNLTRRTGYGFQDVPGSLNLKNYIFEKAFDFYNTMGTKVDPARLSLQMFVSEMLEGDSHKTHVHPNCSLSGVFYLDVPENAAPISFPDPRGHAMYIFPPYGEILKKTDYLYPGNNHEELIYPKTGDLLIWNSWMMHSVPALNFNKDRGRATVVFNIIQKGVSNG